MINVFDINSTDYFTQREEYWNKYIPAVIYILHLKYNLTMEQIGAVCPYKYWDQVGFMVGGAVYAKMEEFMKKYKLPR